MAPDFHKDISPDLRQRREKYNEDRFWQLNSLLNDFSQTAWKYLLTVNGGGVVGILAYIGAVENIRTRCWPYISLAIFMLGLVLVGFSLAHLVHKFQSLQDNWKLDIDEYYKNQITWLTVLERDSKRVKNKSWLPWLLGWGAFFAFLIGVIFTAWKFWSLLPT